jgi:hypothetical protein
MSAAMAGVEPSLQLSGLQLSGVDEIDRRHVSIVRCADKAVLNLIQRSSCDTKEPREFTVAPAAEPFSDIPADGIRRIVKLRSQLEVGVEARTFRQTEDFEALLITEPPDDQLGEVTRDGHGSPIEHDSCPRYINDLTGMYAEVERQSRSACGRNFDPAAKPDWTDSRQGSSYRLNALLSALPTT